jgi:hypothetical protein
MDEKLFLSLHHKTYFQNVQTHLLRRQMAEASLKPLVMNFRVLRALLDKEYDQLVRGATNINFFLSPFLRACTSLIKREGIPERTRESSRIGRQQFGGRPQWREPRHK